MAWSFRKLDNRYQRYGQQSREGVVAASIGWVWFRGAYEGLVIPWNSRQRRRRRKQRLHSNELSSNRPLQPQEEHRAWSLQLSVSQTKRRWNNGRVSRARLRLLTKYCQLQNVDAEIKSHTIQTCLSSRLRCRALSQADLSYLLVIARSIETTVRQVKVIARGPMESTS